MSSKLVFSQSISKQEGFSNSFLILICYALLTLMGVLTLYSANYSYFLSHVKYHVPIGVFVLFLIGWKIPLRIIQSFSYASHFVLIITLFLVLYLGYSAGGAQRWLSIKFIRFQPSEFIKITLVLVSAQFFYNQKLRIKR